MRKKYKQKVAEQRGITLNIIDKINEGLVYFDGGTGTVLQEMGLAAGQQPEYWNIDHPDKITQLHFDYLNAGCNIIKTNTFGANKLKFPKDEGTYSLESIIKAAVSNAHNAVDKAKANGCTQDMFVALDIGPTGHLLKPLGDLEFDDAVEVFKQSIKVGVQCGVDLILIETMNDSYEVKAAVVAAKECCNLPIFVTTVYDENAKLLTGADPAAMTALLEGLGIAAIGMNCSLGPVQMKNIVPQLVNYTSLPVIVNPNAGLPRTENGKTVFDVDAVQFAQIMSDIVKMGARIVGGCCGTNPEYIRQLIKFTKAITPMPLEKKQHTLISSYSHAVEIGKKPILIGERINPTGKKRFKQALNEHDIGYILQEGISQQEKGVHALDVNVGLPGIDEKAMLTEVVCRLQSITDLPLQIDTSDVVAMEAAMRYVNGKPLINSVNGKQESMESIFPLVKKYGGVVIALTLDESGIPQTAEGRVKIAQKIYDTAAKYGIDKKDIVVDTLAMAVSSDSSSAIETLKAVKLIKQMGGFTSLGVSNVSFGLPMRDNINSTYFALALQNGLDAAIINPNSEAMMKTYYSYCALCGYDENCGKYIEFATELMQQQKITAQRQAQALAQMNDKAVPATAVSSTDKASDDMPPLMQAVIKGLKDNAADITAQLIKNTEAMDIIDGQIVPALDVVGKGFENKTVFLPQLLMSAEAAKSSFEVIKTALAAKGQDREQKGKIVLATVKGDIHDIGKNIVRALLENYGYDVIDLGRDVDPQIIADTVCDKDIKLVGLSALMTTTVPSMEQTIKLLNKCAPQCKVVVGGAVLTQEYADMIGADKYARDAMETVRYAGEIFDNQ